MGSGASSESRVPRRLEDIPISDSDDDENAAANAESSEEDEWSQSESEQDSDSDDGLSERQKRLRLKEKQKREKAKLTKAKNNASKLAAEKRLPRNVITERMRWECPPMYKDGFWRNRMGPLNDLLQKDGTLRKTTRAKLLKDRKKAMGKHKR